ncbi:MAG: hypothetical protein DI565_17670 [Ancylobacter novellus]|uniref:Uncharacterized protein n=1 Tax=Ancylobacter novellus TaxID=921 RepID=A0A2W5LW66_ANCNO|nr:MAG: hypothetical protein DI565_17670 [Ancylobacter novellus]
MTAALPKPSDSAFSRAIAHWKNSSGSEGFSAGEPFGDAVVPERRGWSFAPYAIALALAIGAGAAAASFATAPALTDSLDTVSALDARAMGLDSGLDPNGQQKKAAALNKDVGAMKTEITRLQRALDQAKQNQGQMSRSAANAAANNQDEVRSLKAELVNLQKTLDATREQAASKIENLSAKLDQSRGDAQRVTDLQGRLDRIEKQAEAEKRQADQRPAERQARAEDPATTGSVSRDVRAPEVKPDEPAAKIVRNWTVRDVTRGVALLEGRNGLIEVVRGARAPGMGRIRSIERRDGQWVVVTDRGLVLERAEL